MKTLPISELRKLLSEVSSHGVQHLTEVEADLLQTQYLLQEAVEKLTTSFDNINENIAQQQIILDELTQQYQFSRENPLMQHLDGLKTQVGDNVGAVVTSMQFQDMTSQLLVRSLQRLTGIKEMIEALGEHHNAEGVCPINETGEIFDYIEGLKSALNVKSHELAGGFKRSAVSQKDMTTGDVELF